MINNMATTARQIDLLLKKLYFDPVTCYTGVDTLVKAAAAAGTKKVKRHVITEWLGKQDAYALHKPARVKFRRNQTLSKGIDHIWQSDLVDVQPLSRFNNGFRYLLVVIDTFSRYAWVQPLKNKKGTEVLRGLREILTENKPRRKPKKLCTDMGKEYLNKD